MKEYLIFLAASWVLKKTADYLVKKAPGSKTKIDDYALDFIQFIRGESKNIYNKVTKKK
jgi:hypothetical protein